MYFSLAHAHHHHGSGSPSDAGALARFFDWFTGDPGRKYMDLSGCMAGDWLWISLTIALDLAVASGYALIALHWWKSQRGLPPSPAKTALSNIRNIFVFCGVCGYLFIPVKMFWPAWRLYDLIMVALVYFTWRYALGARELKVIYTELGRSKKLAEDLERSREESKRKTSFLNAVSHDLRTPLNGLMLQASLAEVGVATGDKDTLTAAVNEIKAGAKATADLLDSLLEYARMDWAEDRNHVEQVDLAALVAQTASAWQAAGAEKGLEVTGRVPDGLAVQTDRHKLERVLTNLVSNAVKFTDRGGVRIEAARSGPAVEVSVVDTGVGIAAADQEHLFDEFFQVQNLERDRNKGFGLGLSIARRLVRQLGGDITLDSTPGRGSRFTVALPLVPPAARNGSASGSNGHSGNGNGQHSEHLQAPAGRRTDNVGSPVEAAGVAAGD